MRALLVVNRRATNTSERTRDVLVRALRSEVDVEVAYTARRNHATALARQAAGSGVGLVAVHAGDGTVNEVVNGLMSVGSTAAARPALAVVPGGSTNVFARALGLPREWAEAAGVLLEALRESRSRTIGLGRADDRYFTFCAGMGLDAAVVRRVEQARLRGRINTPSLYARAILDHVMRERDRRRPALTLETPSCRADGASEQLATVIVQNTSPWTYLGDRPINPNPDASFDQGLDVLAIRALRVPSVVRTFGQMLSQRGGPHGRQVRRWHDLAELTLRASRPVPCQVDGDYLGERQKVQLTAVPEALRVLC
jgi:diacylglycerol kinase family enzyme